MILDAGFPRMWTFTLVLGMTAGLDLPSTIDDLSTIRAAGDANGDGICDVLVADRDGFGTERVRIVSGSDGAVIRELRGRKAGDCFGYSMACVGDLDADGKPEIAIGARGGESIVKEGDLVLSTVRNDERQAYVRVFSGADGRVLQEFEGRFICGRAGDFDIDGKPDLLLGEGDTSLRERGFVEVWSTAKDRALLHLNSWDADPSPSFGASSCVLPDVDGDAIPEVVVCAPGWSGDRGRVSTVVLASGERGRTLAEVKGAKEWDHFGWTLVEAGDLDGDGQPDLLVSAPKLMISALSGRSLTTLYTLPSVLGDIEGFATTLDMLPDLDGDGVPDFVVGCDEDPDLFDGGYANLHSGKDGGELPLKWVRATEAGSRRTHPIFSSATEGVEVCTLRDGKWRPTDRVVLRIRTRIAVDYPDAKVREMLQCEQRWRDALRIVDLRSGETVLEKEIRRAD